MSKVTMSLNEIYAFKPCKSGITKLMKALGKIAPDDEQIGLDIILESNGIQDTIWCFRVKWFEHKPLFMEFVNNCIARSKDHAADAAADAAYDAAADAAADAAYAAAYAAAAADAAATAAAAAYAAAAAAATYAAAAAATAAADERNKQKDFLLTLLKA